MAKKKKHEEHENHERWLVSYADFITLLFAFFVVMYSTSSVNEGKFRAVSESAKAAFNPSHYSAKKISIGPKFPHQKTSAVQQRIIAIRHVLKDLLKAKKVKIFQTAKGIVIRITDTALFDSGSAKIKEEVLPIIDRLAGVLSTMEEKIQVEGHTDNIPIRNSLYPSNWELSAARAASIVRRFVMQGVDPKRLVAIGYGQYHPIADNSTPEGRARNRRVDIVILNKKEKHRTEFKNPFAQIKIE